MTDEIYRRETLLARYSLVGGPAEMVPLLERVAEVCAANPEVAALARRQAAAIFEETPVPTTDDLKRWTMPERELGEALGAYCMMLALSGVPKIAATHRRLGLGEEQLARTYSWYRAMIAVYARRHGGVPGIEHTRLFWFRNHADGILFRFGNMEFLRGPVPDYVPSELKASLGPEDEIPTFHFPGGEGGLDTAKMRASFAEAMAFWKRTFGRYPKAWACDSWLYNPVWKELIPDSRIAHVIDNFEFVGTLPPDPKKPSGLYYVYGNDTCDPRDWPAANSLERAFCEVYRRGEKLVEGCAVVRCDESGRVLFQGGEGAASAAESSL